ncbi:hypothetical protein [Zoogloea sp.]|uniref:hypothetical protein n=1 Tax=Zoogloea sp. TaxID=49181 RepID=UPI0025DEC008|nr:hypothetical protein [Zoogloea sp.]
MKPLYGHQDGAEISYNPTKPGRPSHAIHTYWIANLRLVLDAQVQSGKEHAARHSLPHLRRLLDALPPGETTTPGPGRPGLWQRRGDDRSGIPGPGLPSSSCARASGSRV